MIDTFIIDVLVAELHQCISCYTSKNVSMSQDVQLVEELNVSLVEELYQFNTSYIYD